MKAGDFVIWETKKSGLIAKGVVMTDPAPRNQVKVLIEEVKASRPDIKKGQRLSIPVRALILDEARIKAIAEEKAREEAKRLERDKRVREAAEKRAADEAAAEKAPAKPKKASKGARAEKLKAEDTE